jgi:hypothetical protein
MSARNSAITEGEASAIAKARQAVSRCLAVTVHGCDQADAYIKDLAGAVRWIAEEGTQARDAMPVLFDKVAVLMACRLMMDATFAAASEAGEQLGQLEQLRRMAS